MPPLTSHIDPAELVGLSRERLLTRFDSSKQGLSAQVARNRLDEFGDNRFGVTRKRGLLKKVFDQLNSPLILILAFGVVLSALIGNWHDAATIAAIVVANALLGLGQEWRAERAVQALRKMLSPHVRVMRDGIVGDQPIESLVPGDIVVLERGTRVPADIIIIDAVRLMVDESVLTGESLPVEKSPLGPESGGAGTAAFAYAGTLVLHGHAKALVVATGDRTRFGHVAMLTGTVSKEASTLQQALARLARQLGIGAFGVGLLIVAIGVVNGRPLVEILMTAIALAIAVVPEGLPAAVTLTLAIGVYAMARRGALLRRMQAAETLGATTVICTDKTGTLTQNVMTAVRVWLPDTVLAVSGIGYAPEGTFEEDGKHISTDDVPSLQRLLDCALECNNATLVQRDGEWLADGLPTELALLTLARKGRGQSAQASRRLGEVPFESERKRMSVITDGGAPQLYTKGAPEVMLALCSQQQVGNDVEPLDDAKRQRIEQVYKDFAEQGLRVLALAGKQLAAGAAQNDPETLERDLTLLGLVGIMDPPRAEVADAVAQARAAGIGVIMMTGDGASTAVSVAQSVGMRGEPVLEGHAIDEMADSLLSGHLGDGAVLARVAPEHKLRIVELLQAGQAVVAMTGDGVNDAPALKRANVGVSMGQRGTEVAKEASDIVLSDDNFASIVYAIAEGRRQFQNIRRFVSYMLSSNAGEVVAIVLSSLIGGPLILLPVQILWMNLVTDGVTAIALGAEPGRAALMREPPRPVDQPLLQRKHFLLIAVLGGYIGLVTCAMFFWYLPRDGSGSAAYAQTMAFTTIIILEKFNVLNFRSLGDPLHRIGWFSNPWVMLALVATIASQFAVVYLPFFNRVLHTVPLSAQDWLVIVLVSLPILIVPEIVKLSRSRGGS